MREKIATNLYKICSASRYGANFPEWETLQTDQQDFFRNKAQLLFLTLIREEIEKELDGREEDMIADVDYKEGWLDCRHWILTLLRSK